MGNTPASSEEQKKKEDVNKSSAPVHVVVPEKFKDPITNKIMKNPMMVLSSMSIYDKITIDKWMKSKRGFDPLTGIPMAYGKWPILLTQRMDIEFKIERFIEDNPSFQNDVLNEKDEIEWETLFVSYDESAKQKYQQILNDQSSLRVKAKQLFKPSDGDDGDMGIVYNESIVLRADVPIICIMGPSRNGKSTIVNDILGVKQATGTSSNPNVAFTKGAWIAKYESNPKDYSNVNTVFSVQVTQDDEGEAKDNDSDDDTKDEGDQFYILDMEGLSHDVTKFTKRLFYACYATSDVIVWNDKEVASDRFKRLMKALQDEMKSIAMSDCKPSFIYLKRDAEDCICDPYDSLDQYMNKHESLEWFRKMNIFSSISAYELDRPLIDRKNKQLPFNFHSKQENHELLQPLIKQLIFLSKHSKRFSSNMWKLKQQIEHINKSTVLSMTKELILGNKVLQYFILPPKAHANRRRDMTFVACEFNWDHDDLRKKFDKEMTKMKELLTQTTEKNEKILTELEANKDEIYQRVKNKTKFVYVTDETQQVLFMLTSVASGAIIGGLVMGVTVMTGGSAAAVMIAGSTMGDAIFASMVGGGVVGFYSGLAYQWMDGNYIKFSLGKTDKEIEDDHQQAKLTSKTPYSGWEDSNDSDYYYI
eukprot:251201_1